MHYLFLILSFLTGMVSSSVFASEAEYMLEEAKKQQLATSPTWLALLHYKKEPLSGVIRSQADDDAFFLSGSGMTDPSAELEAAIAAFITPAASNHAQCRFPARWFWLKTQLGIALAEYDVSCPKLQGWLDRAAADKLTLVFPAMYLNNPGSMFGHTFIRFDNSKNPILLSYTLNYAAKVTPGDGFLAYAYNGLSGGYNGVFGIRSYYQTVQTYSDIENRDIWEYQLDYTQEEITQLLRHVWEVTDMRFDYYFLNENCSYRLLSLLDAVKPQANLSSTESFPVYAIPVDTIRALDEKDLILARRFRPSLATQIERGSLILSSGENETAIALASNDITFKEFKNNVADKQQRALVLDQTYNLLQFRDQAESKLASQILSERSTLPKSPKQVYTAIRPETGHASVLASIGLGEVRDKKNIRLQLRPAFHGLLDDPTGYVEGAEISALDTRLNWLTQKDELQIEKITFVNVTALVPVKSWQKTLSWRLSVGLDRTPLNLTRTTLAFLTSGSVGVSAKLADLIFFALADVEVNASKRYTKGYSTLFGWSSGVMYPFGFGQLKLEYQDVGSFGGAEIDRVTSSIDVNFNISRGMSLRVGYEAVDYGGFNADEWGVGVNFYF